MSAINYITSIPIFQGAQGKYYVINGVKYHMRFPLDWALNHEAHYVPDCDANIKTGPVDCGNCKAYGSIRGVFVGYCSNCLRQYIEYGNDWRGHVSGLSIESTAEKDIWDTYPYMTNIPKAEIGDEEGADLTDHGITFEDLEAAIARAEEAREQDDEENEEEGEEEGENGGQTPKSVYTGSNEILDCDTDEEN